MSAVRKRRYIPVIAAVVSAIASSHARASADDIPPKPADPQDPFADLAELAPQPKQPEAPLSRSWRETFFKENFGFRKEIMSQFDMDQDGRGASRQSLGFEVLKKF